MGLPSTSLGVASALGLGGPVMISALVAAVGGVDAGMVALLVTGSVGWIFPLLSWRRHRRIQIRVTATAVEITWRSGAIVTSRRSYALGVSNTATLRLVTDDDEVWIAAGGVPGPSVQWLAEEISRVARVARERDADGPAVELEELLSDATQAQRKRALALSARRKQRA